jgi:Zn-dependent M28 family amino/carboxypeptidase
MLELARRLAARPPRRSALLLAFGAEELGLIGSRVFVDNPSVDLGSLAVVLNLDMVGRLGHDGVTIYGTQDAALRSLVESANPEPKLHLTLLNESSGRSDDYSFAARGVRALHFTTGYHADYHRPGDTPARIELAGLARVTDLVERVARAAAGERR